MPKGAESGTAPENPLYHKEFRKGSKKSPNNSAILSPFLGP